MKIFANIPGAFKLINCLRYVNPYMRKVEAARASGDTEKERECILDATAYWGTKTVEMLGSTVTVHGEENLPDKGPLVMVGNHQGYADIITYFAAFRKFQFAFVAKEDLSKIPFYGKYLQKIRCVFIKRDDPKAALRTINEGIDYIRNGFSLVIFPEGTRSKGGEPHPFQHGAFKLATKPGVPIVPVSIEGSYKMFEECGYIKGADIHIMVHEPIETKGMSRQEQKELPERVEKIVMDGVKALKEERL